MNTHHGVIEQKRCKVALFFGSVCFRIRLVCKSCGFVFLIAGGVGEGKSGENKFIVC